MNVKNVIVGMAMVLGFSVSAQKTATETTLDLPQTAKTFINKNFGKNKISHSTKETTMGMIKEYKVYLNDGTKVEFDGNGEWEEIDGNHNAVPNKAIPNKILNYVNKSFPGTKVVKIEKDRKGYDVELSNGLDLEFNAQADFLRIDD